MSKGVNRLRLGPLPKTEVVKLTIALTTTLKADLERYAALHSQTYGEAVDASALVPHMLAAFMARDRGFRRRHSAPVSTVKTLGPGGGASVQSHAGL